MRTYRPVGRPYGRTHTGPVYGISCHYHQVYCCTHSYQDPIVVLACRCRLLYCTAPPLPPPSLLILSLSLLLPLPPLPFLYVVSNFIVAPAPIKTPPSPASLKTFVTCHCCRTWYYLPHKVLASCLRFSWLPQKISVHTLRTQGSDAEALAKFFYPCINYRPPWCQVFSSHMWSPKRLLAACASLCLVTPWPIVLGLVDFWNQLSVRTRCTQGSYAEALAKFCYSWVKSLPPICQVSYSCPWSLGGSSPRWEKLSSGYHNYLLKGLHLRYMYCSQKQFSE